MDSVEIIIITIVIVFGIFSFIGYTQIIFHEYNKDKSIEDQVSFKEFIVYLKLKLLKKI